MSNKSTRPKAWQVILVLTIFLGAIYLTWLSLTSVWKIFSGLQKEVAAALIAASATVVVSVITVIVGKYYERKREIELEHRNKKIPIYEEFVEFLFKLLMSEKLNDRQMTEDEMLKFFIMFTQKLLVWGSDEVVTQWSKYRRLLINENDVDTSTNMFELEKLLLAIRKDTGHKNKNFEKGEILGLFINDVDKYL